MKMNRSLKLLLLGAAALLLIIAAGANPQLSLDEQEAIVQAVVQTMNPEAMKAAIVAEVEADLIAKLNAAGYVGVAGAIAQPLQKTPEAAPAAAGTDALPAEVPFDGSTEAEAAAPSPTPLPASERPVDDIRDYADGAVLQPDGTYRGLHAKQVNAYAYTLGEDENGVVRQFHTEYTPNVRFNVDVVFENDGSVVWPPRIEMRHVGNVGEYTGHAESMVIDRTYDPIKPGDRCAITVSAYGSENLGWTTFYFQLYDADSGSVIEGGYASFTYHAI